MKVKVYNQQAKAVGELEVRGDVFGVKAKPALLAEVVRIQQMNARSAQAHTKTRGDVSGGGKKPWKQKGTGRARAGSTRSPIWRHGGVALGPTKDRNWHRDLNKKVKKQALCMALSDKLQAGKMIVVDRIDLETPKTKLFNQILQVFKSENTGIGKKPLLILPKADTSIIRAMRNLPGVTSLSARSLNPLAVLSADSIMVLQDSVPVIETIYGTAKPVKE